MLIDAYIASAFAKNGAGGNPAGVVLPDNQLSDLEKIRIAAQLGYSETAFVSPSKPADYKLEYFTPKGEVPLCGHATIGTFIVLHALQLLKKSDYTIETSSGILEIRIEETGSIFMQQRTPQFYEIVKKSELKDCFRPQRIHETLPIQIVSTGLKDILFPVATPDALKDLIPDFDAISQLSKEKNCIGLHAFALTAADELTAICRNFAPRYGIKEESATGTSNCALACYLHQYGMKQNLYTFEQGHHLNSVSRIYVKIENEGDTITRVSVGGEGYLLGRKGFAI